jgi:hypothetical protein
MLQDIVGSALRAAPDMDIIGLLPTLRSAEELTSYGPADMVIVGLTDGELPEPCMMFIRKAPSNRIIGIAPNGRRSMLCVLAPKTKELGEISPQGLINAIRSAIEEVPAT